MPPKRASTKGKEPKETVVYAASKRKAPPFKPQRPGKLPRETSESESSGKATASQKESRPQIIDEEEEEEQDEKNRVEPARADAAAGENDSNDSGDSEEELAADPLAAKPKTKPTARSIPPPKPPPAASKRKKPTRPKSPVPISDDNSSPRSSPPAGGEQPPVPSQSSETPSVPQNLLVRLLHEHLRDKKTQIDKNAIQVLDKYIEVFVREAIARTSLSKQERAASGEILADDARWLELEDLERVAPGLVLDF
ncbi:hypothetical protein KC318_g12523 [Hortaea werneckii]|nr:hypothetical protein KC334_g6861 [Hortaea werneckii]KAI6952750.1 hypothetical protein KC355_g13900 [Hortaea werneckii]KAI7180902.1 hypothetical protein KC324_g8913 [Hortaea werneckii]KAI7584723.1 hypothetical protein KC316_g6536 [Hortaea werneckii]KAI7656238.1 hypothetical protein KC318_g12523 [Hortaea werneckii]